MQLPAGMFYHRKDHKKEAIVPCNPNVSEDDDMDEDDDDVADPDFLPDLHHDPHTPGSSDMGPPAKRKCGRPTVELMHTSSSEEEEEEEGDDQVSQASKSKPRKRKDTPRVTTWSKVDITNSTLPSYQHSPPLYVQSPQHYFFTFFTIQMVEHITYQTNLYATQKDVNTNFSTNKDEILNFVAILLYMGVVQCPSLDDYWCLRLRVPQVADVMSSKRFRLLRRRIHFNDNTQVPGTIDRFFKIRPLFTFINRVFRNVPETPKQSIDEVMVAYKGRTAGTLRQYIKNKPDKWGFKLFSRASEDGFIHDTILYQGKTTLQAHGIPLTPQQEAMGVTSQIVSVLASTMQAPTTSAIFADNYFTSLELVRYLKEKGCRYTGTARENRIGKPPLKPTKDMEKKSVPRGSCEYLTSDDNILVLKWKDNKVVTMLSTDLGVEPVTKCQRYCSDTKNKEDVPCPNVIKSYNANMGGIDKSDMLVHLYKTPLKSKRWYMRLFAYIIDLCLINAWLLYRRDCKALKETGMPLKDFRVEVFWCAAGKKSTILRPNRTSVASPCTSSSLSTSVDLPPAIRGHLSHKPDPAVRFDVSLFHAPLFVTRQTCKFCSKKGHIIRSNILCKVCKVHLCLNDKRNCFVEYHMNVA